ncbi:MAG: hypothetical protein AMJ81_07385 [Phycisphaerae bacterium SM23_33]|jgi:putative phosphoesterase|nr:MAG: hypothetical protein AMJ81_07385 [Phycisphaerae bacterium SM23_33]
MKIGIVSDSHGKADRLRQAVELLVGRGAQAIVHCGDIGSAECVDALAGAGVPAYAVAGNMDRHLDRLQARAQEKGVHFSLDTILVPIGGGSYLAATHGSNALLVRALAAEGRFPYVCHGHTHAIRDERIQRVRIINPGALHHAQRRTAALLDTDADTLEHLELS